MAVVREGGIALVAGVGRFLVVARVSGRVRGPTDEE